MKHDANRMKYEINNAHSTLLDELQTKERRHIRTNAEALEETYYEYNGQSDDVTDFYGNTYEYFSLKGVRVG